MPAIPALIAAGGAIGSTLLSNKAQKDAAAKAQQQSPEELALLTSQTNLANQQAAQGAQAYATAMPAIKSTLDYYQSLLSGNRAARMNAVSGEAQDTAQAYQGADVAAKKNLRGGELAESEANNATARAGAISRLVTGVRPGAAAATAGVGQGLLGSAAGFEGSGASTGANVLTNETENRFQGNAVGQKQGALTADSLGQLFARLAGSFGGNKGNSSFLAPPVQGAGSLSPNGGGDTYAPPASLSY